MIKRFLSILFLIIALVHDMDGQFILTELNAIWDDDLGEWELSFFDEEDNQTIGHLSRRWPLRDNWEEWAYDLEGFSGFIRTKWKGQLDHWELRGNNEVVDIRVRWRNDVNEWTITHRGKRLVVKTEYPNNANIWVVRSNAGSLDLYTAYQNDPRDWIIEDDLIEVSVEQKVAIIFICLFQSIPRT